MRQCRSGAVIALLVSMALSGRAQTKTIAERLGYPPDSKLLIIHADDLAVAHSVDAASFGALDKNAVTSASVMSKCAYIPVNGRCQHKCRTNVAQCR